ncbi:MAG TPA: alpha/beta hydrolase [Acidimicrobiia bacterium]|nr:alpha/beta hydrolase [Acidimicrobiia bacterium]
MDPNRTPNRRRRAGARVAVGLLATWGLLAVGIVPAAASLRSVEVRTGIAWRTISGETLLLDLYLPDDALLPYAPDAVRASRSAMVLVHGGGWRGGDRSDLAIEGEAIAQRGGVAVSIDYRLVPEHPYPAALDDVLAAVRWLRDDAQARRFGIDTARIAIGGVSAGGQLAAMAGTIGRGSERVAAVVTWSGVFDFNALDILDPAVLGCAPGQCPLLAALASPITHVGPGDAPMLLVTGRRDQITPVAQAREMAATLQRAGVDHRLVTVSGRGHATQLAPEAAAPSLDFLAQTVGLDTIALL